MKQGKPSSFAMKAVLITGKAILRIENQNKTTSIVYMIISINVTDQKYKHRNTKPKPLDLIIINNGIKLTLISLETTKSILFS